MKKITIVFTMMMFVGNMFAAGNVKDLIFDYEGQAGSMYIETDAKYLSPAQHLLANEFWKKFSLLYAGEEEADFIGVADVSSLTLLSLDNCSDEIKTSYMNRAIRIDAGKYELISKVKTDGTNILIYGKEKKGVIAELVLVTVGNKCSIATLKGCFDRNKLETAGERIKG